MDTEQQARMADYVAKWTAIGLETKPADRPLAEQGISELYRSANMAVPKHILWCDSPVDLLLTMLKVKTSIDPRVDRIIGNGIGNILGQDDSTVDGIVRNVRRDVLMNIRSVRATLERNIATATDTTPINTVAWNVISYNWQEPHGWGQHNAPGVAQYEYECNEYGRSRDRKLEAIKKLTEAAGWWWVHQNVVFISERHNRVFLDKEHRLHCEDGMAVSYPDGWGLYCWHGAVVPENVILHPDWITSENVDKERNVEVRRVMTTRYDALRYKGAYLIDGGAKLIDSREFGEPPRVYWLFKKTTWGEEPTVMVECQNATPEPDGSFKPYFIRVPPDMTNAHAAIAWTFGFEGENYRPGKES